jgi:hypothetical protein
MTDQRTVECLGGPMDGAAVDVDAAVELPDTISFPATLGSPRRYIYDRCVESKSFTAYRYDHFEVGT